MPRPSTPLLSRRAIAEAALELIDGDGLEGLTMRKLGARLGVEAASLYHHVASRDDLLDEVSAIIDEQIDISAMDETDWRAAVRGYARSYRGTFARHPNVIATIMRRPVRTVPALTAYDRGFAMLLRAGWGPADAGAILAAIDYIVLGSALLTFAAGFDRPPEEYAPDYPHLARGLAESDPATLDERGFELALETFVTGLESPR